MQLASDSPLRRSRDRRGENCAPPSVSVSVGRTAVYFSTPRRFFHLSPSFSLPPPPFPLSFLFSCSFFFQQRALPSKLAVHSIFVHTTRSLSPRASAGVCKYAVPTRRFLLSLAETIADPHSAFRVASRQLSRSSSSAKGAWQRESGVCCA